MSAPTMPEVEAPETEVPEPANMVADDQATDESWTDDDEDDELVQPEANEDADVTEPSPDDATAEVPATPTEPTPSASAPEPEPALEPIRLPVGTSGQTYAPPGMFYDPKANAFKFETPASAQRAFTLMKHGANYERNREKFESVDQKIEEVTKAAQKEANDVLESLEEAANTLPPEQLLQRVYALVDGMPKVRLQIAQAEIERLRGGVNAPAAGPDFGYVDTADITIFAQGRASATIQADAASGNYPWMTPQAVEALRAIASDPQMTARFTYKATADDLRENPALRINEPYFHIGDFRQALAPYAQAWIDAHRTVSTIKTDAAKQVQTLATPAKTNAAILAAANKQPSAKPKPTAPPAAETDEDRERNARNELGQFIAQAVRGSQVRRRA